jgi:hypothetical protein
MNGVHTDAVAVIDALAALHSAHILAPSDAHLAELLSVQARRHALQAQLFARDAAELAAARGAAALRARAALLIVSQPFPAVFMYKRSIGHELAVLLVCGAATPAHVSPVHAEVLFTDEKARAQATVIDGAAAALVGAPPRSAVAVFGQLFVIHTGSRKKLAYLRFWCDFEPRVDAQTARGDGDEEEAEAEGRNANAKKKAKKSAKAAKSNATSATDTAQAALERAVSAPSLPFIILTNECQWEGTRFSSQKQTQL